MKINYKLSFLVLIATLSVCFLTYPVSAESGEIVLTNTTIKTYTPGGTCSAASTQYLSNSLNFYSAGYSKVAYMNFTPYSVASWTTATGWTTFTIVSGGTGSGLLSWSQYLNKITWVFSEDVNITGSSVGFSYTDTSKMPTFTNLAVTDDVSLAMPVGLSHTAGGLCSGQNQVRGTYNADMGYVVRNSYEVIYPMPGQFVATIFKTGATVATWARIKSYTGVYDQETAYTLNNFTASGYQAQGIYVNITASDGQTKEILVNSSGIPGYIEEKEIVVDPITGVGIKVTPTTGYQDTVFNISWLRTKPTPFGYIDSVEIYESGITAPVHVLTSPPDSGYSKNTFTIASYTVKFIRTYFLFGTPEVLASASFVVSPVPPSYILVDTKYYVNQSKNITYFIGDPLASIQDYYYNSETKKYESTKGGWWGSTTGIESNWSYKCLYPAKMKFAIILPGVNWGDAPTELSTVYSECVTDTTKPEYDILNSYLNIVPGSTNLLEYVDVSYAVPSVDWVGNISYLRNYYNGNVIWSHIIDRQMYYNMSYFVRPTPGKYYHMTVGTGANTIKLETSTGTVLNTSTLIISATNTEGYGLEFDKLLFCSGEVIKFKYYSPDAVNFSIWDSDGKLVYLKKLNASFEGKVMEINFKKIGVFDVRLLDPNALQKMNRIITIDSCVDGVIDDKTYGGNITATCGFWDNCVNGVFPGQGLNNVTRLLFALFCIVVMMFFGMVVSKGNFGVSVILGFLPYAFFTYLTLSSPCGEYMPVWVSIFIALIVGIKMKWFS